MEDTPFLSEVEKRNFADKDILEASAATLRDRMIGSAFEGLKIYWRKQIEGHRKAIEGGSPDARFDEYILYELAQGLPFEGDEPLPSLSLLFRPDPSLDIASSDEHIESVQEDNKHAEYMRIFVPVPEQLDEDREDFDIEDLPVPDRIGIELGSSEGVHAKYVIDADRITPFVSAHDSGEETIYDEWENEHGDALRKRVDTGMPITSRLFENFTNWSATVQRSISLRELDQQLDTPE